MMQRRKERKNNTVVDISRYQRRRRVLGIVLTILGLLIFVLEWAGFCDKTGARHVYTPGTGIWCGVLFFLSAGLQLLPNKFRRHSRFPQPFATLPPDGRCNWQYCCLAMNFITAVFALLGLANSAAELHFRLSMTSKDADEVVGYNQCRDRYFIAHWRANSYNIVKAAILLLICLLAVPGFLVHAWYAWRSWSAFPGESQVPGAPQLYANGNNSHMISMATPVGVPPSEPLTTPISSPISRIAH